MRQRVCACSSNYASSVSTPGQVTLHVMHITRHMKGTGNTTNPKGRNDSRRKQRGRGSKDDRSDGCSDKWSGCVRRRGGDRGRNGEEWRGGECDSKQREQQQEPQREDTHRATSTERVQACDEALDRGKKGEERSGKEGRRRKEGKGKVKDRKERDRNEKM